LLSDLLLTGLVLFYSPSLTLGLASAVLALGILVLESRAIKPGNFGFLSCAASASLAAAISPSCGPSTAVLLAVAGVGLRSCLRFENFATSLRSILADLTPVLAAVGGTLLAQRQSLSLGEQTAMAVPLYLVVGTVTVRILYQHNFEAQSTRRRFLLANAIAAIPLVNLLESSPLAAFFLFPLLLVVQHGGYGVVMSQRREELARVTKQLKMANSQVQKASKVSLVQTREIKQKEVDRKLLEDFSVFFSKNPSVDEILENSVAALEHMLKPRKLLVFSFQRGSFQAQKWTESASPVVAKIPPEGIQDPLLLEVVQSRQTVDARSWENTPSSRLVREVGPGLGLPLPGYGVIYFVTDQELSERHANLLITIASQVALGLESAAYREKLSQALSHKTAALAQLEESQAQLVQSGKMAAVGLLAAGVAHELNSPLAAVLLQLQAGKMRLESGKVEKVARSLDIAERATNKAQKIIEKLLRFSHISEQRRVRVSIENLFQETLDVVGPQLRKAGLEVSVESSPEAIVLGDPNELQQVLTNLLLNAQDAALENRETRKPAITLRVESGPEVTISVIDSGPGLDPATEGRIFEPFFTTKNIGQGTGLGLSISYQIAQAHKGSLKAENGKSGGAIFRLTLPEWQPESPEP